jgi:hypothetical protein
MIQWKGVAELRSAGQTGRLFPRGWWWNWSLTVASTDLGLASYWVGDGVGGSIGGMAIILAGGTPFA